MLGAWGVWAEPESDRFDHRPWGLGLMHFCLGNTSEQVSFGTGAPGSTVEPATGLPGIRLSRFPPRFPAPLPLGRARPETNKWPVNIMNSPVTGQPRERDGIQHICIKIKMDK